MIRTSDILSGQSSSHITKLQLCFLLHDIFHLGDITLLTLEGFIDTESWAQSTILVDFSVIISRWISLRISTLTNFEKEIAQISSFHGNLNTVGSLNNQVPILTQEAFWIGMYTTHMIDPVRKSKYRFQWTVWPERNPFLHCYKVHWSHSYGLYCIHQCENFSWMFIFYSRYGWVVGVGKYIGQTKGVVFTREEGNCPTGLSNWRYLDQNLSWQTNGNIYVKCAS